MIVVTECAYGTSEQQKVKNLIDGQRVEEVNEFNYLRIVLNSAEYREEDIQSRIAMRNKAFVDKTPFSSGLNVDLKKRIIKCFVWSVWHMCC